MRTGATLLGLLGCLALMGCAHEVRPQAREIPDEVRQAIEEEVAATIRAFMAGFSAAKCEDVSTVSRFVRNEMIYVSKEAVFTVPLADYEQGLRERVCGWASHAGVVDSVTVDALSRDVAVAAWQYHDEVQLKSGETRHFKGSTLMTLVRSANGWKISSTMSAEE